MDVIKRSKHQIMPFDVPDPNQALWEAAGITAEDRANLLREAFVVTRQQLRATKVEYFSHQGKVKEKHKVADHPTRAKAAERTLHLLGVSKPKEVKVVRKVNVVLPDWAYGISEAESRPQGDGENG